ncbi:hypothetical protein CDAR_573241 [Caerostris darwini]|uniref:Uncharacterized protein n=1 Tax=Caerostris darwini TaxID=1538125 RepID=A0AAV4M536_9ARAC|nr:hypothetical protein CDAR_573241 [Caerostris darwini]
MKPLHKLSCKKYLPIHSRSCPRTFLVYCQNSGENKKLPKLTIQLLFAKCFFWNNLTQKDQLDYSVDRSRYQLQKLSASFQLKLHIISLLYPDTSIVSLDTTSPSSSE